MDKRYEAFCLADRVFYDSPARARRTEDSADAWETVRRPVPEGWSGEVFGDWYQLTPAGARLPGQGWKIHVSACLDNADATAARIWDYCVPRRIPFKFVPTRGQLFLRNSKYAGRDRSGKFATVYPDGEEQLRTVLEELGDLLDGEPGPYVLTDLRWRSGPLYVRYGAFSRRRTDDGSGRLVPALENAEGVLVPDRRAPAFSVPEWIRLPEFLAPQLAARNATTVRDLPYRIDGALHFSNGGGVYHGTDTRSGEPVVLKEARPHAGLAADGMDAVARLEREKAVLDRLAGLSVVPAVRDWLALGDHRFLVMDRLPGRTLNSFFAERHPLLTPAPDRAALAAYTDWALGVHRAVTDAVAAIHDRGVVCNDLHMFNVMVAPEPPGGGEPVVALLDFEAASHPGHEIRQVVAHPGFLAPPDRVGPAVDHYALACLALALFLPLTTLLPLDAGKAAELARLAEAEFPDLPPGFLAAAVDEIEGRAAPAVPRTAGAPAGPRPEPRPPAPGDWPRSRDAMVRAIRAAATVDRTDRIFPGDVAQFTEEGGGLALAHGAAGVLYALSATGAEPYPEGEQWLLRAAGRAPSAMSPGLYDGLGGVAWVLHRLGHREAALRLAERLAPDGWRRLPSDLYGGLAGLGLVCDDLAAATGEGALRDQAATAARLLAERLGGPADHRTGAPDGGTSGRPKRRADAGDRAGLLYGATGPALLLLRTHERTGDPAWLDAAGAALRRDLARCTADRHGTWLVDEGSRLMPYLGAGSVGIGMVLDDYLAHRPGEEDLQRARAAIAPAARSAFYAQPGLFRGRAGMVLHLSRTPAPPPGSPGAPDAGGSGAGAALAAQIDAMTWYAVPYGGGLAFPGDQMMRLSMDLATGTAGCLLALGAALDGAPAHLPFLPPPVPADRAGGPDSPALAGDAPQLNSQPTPN